MITPMMLAMVIRMLKPKVMTRIPRFSTRGSFYPKDWPKFSQDKNGTPDAASPMKPPKTIPDKTMSRSTQEFLLLMILPRVCYTI